MRLLSLLALFATANAAPTLDKRLNACGISSFSADFSNPGSISDCEVLVSQLSQTLSINNFPAFTYGGDWYEVGDFSTCAFWVRSIRNNRATIGNEDVYDLLRDSLRGGARGTAVGAKGTMQCNGVDVEWRVGRSSNEGGPTIVPVFPGN
ncbi:hypothetical protein B0T16DRAFT_410759 [Cercophora newfieldiana]|uniref:Ecp2 effector protein-like domain-containing protein n=1 Tax=Cercophora newfieldiana TaxID=92897 RepID=A0AA40CUR7_9PEZI|nr:hypothetical protein B0T16DRAFT_410759 [Cercophora newfieldiana]